MQFSIKDNFPDVQRYIDSVGKQARYAAAVALTRTAKEDVRPALVAEMARAFDRPTPYTLNSLYMRGATPSRLEAVVWVKDDRAGSGTPATKYLLPQIEGGKRSLKRFERVLQATGNMPVGWFAVPGRFAKLDQFGNVSQGQIIQILSHLNAQVTGGYSRNISTDKKKRARAIARAGGQFLAFPNGRGKLLPGIYQVTDFGHGRAAPRPIIIFVRGAKYRRLFKFQEVATQAALTAFPGHFQDEFTAALRSAR